MKIIQIELSDAHVEKLNTLRRSAFHGPCDGTCSSCELYRELKVELSDYLLRLALNKTA